ncbi:MAG TPA: Crp/Fnr family transcriptional regulator [Candidatus Xenobia bacterium]|jgi:CRP-like cAMP-binding protein
MKEEMLKSVPLFAHLSSEHLKALAELAQPRHLGASTVLWTRGEQKDALVLLTRGRMKVLLNNEDGREVTLNVLTAPSYLGDMSVLDRSTHSATVMSLEPCELLWISGSDFRDLVAHQPSVVWEMLMAQTARVRSLSEELASLALLSTCRRVARKVLQLAGATNHADISHQELASLVGSTRESVTRALAELDGDGYLHTHKQRIEIVNPGGLSRLIEDG